MMEWLTTSTTRKGDVSKVNLPEKSFEGHPNSKPVQLKQDKNKYLESVKLYTIPSIKKVILNSLTLSINSYDVIFGIEECINRII